MEFLLVHDGSAVMLIDFAAFHNEGHILEKLYVGYRVAFHRDDVREAPGLYAA